MTNPILIFNLLLFISFVFIQIIGADGINYATRNYQKNNYSLESDKYCFTNVSIPGILALNSFIHSLNNEVQTMKSLSTRKEYQQRLIRIKQSMCYTTTQEGIRQINRDASDFLDSVKKYEKCNFCTSKDQFGNEWAVCEGETAVIDCPPNSRTGNIKWKCTEHIKFETEQPDYSQCGNEKLEKLKNRLEASKAMAKLMELEPEQAVEILSELYEIVSPRNTDNARGASFSRKSNINYFGHEIEEISLFSANTALQTRKNISHSKMEEITKLSLMVILSTLANQEQWNQLSRERRPEIATKVLTFLESIAFNLERKNKSFDVSAKTFYHSEPFEDDIYTLNYYTESSPILMVFGSKSNTQNGNETVVVSDGKIHHGTSITVNISQMSQNSFLNSSSREEVKFVGMIIPSEYVASNLQPISKKNSTSNVQFGEDEREKINGKIVSFSLSQNGHAKFKDDSVTVKFEHNDPTFAETQQVFRRRLHPGEIRKAYSFCAFWDTEELKWSTEGCHKINSLSNDLTSTCSCNHLTAFSVLMGYHEYAEKYYDLKILTWILCPLSILCLALTTAILATVKCARSEQSKITIHLCITLIFGNIILLCTDKDNFYLDDWTCTVLGALSHYIWLCAFLWMAMQGIHLYYKVIKVFYVGKYNLFKTYAAVAYGLPLVIVALTAAIGFSLEKHSIYVGEMYCWLNGQYLWSFKIPVLITVIGNAVVLVIVMHIASKKNSSQKDRQGSINKKLLTGIASLSTLLGMTWFVGFFSLVDTPGNEVIPYIFTVLNASQGIFIFIFHCCLNETIRTNICQTVRETLSFTNSFNLSSSVTTNFKNQQNHNESAVNIKI